jgi:hypothetical protein
MEEGYDRIKASAYAWSHTAAPMLAGTLVTAIGFMPMVSPSQRRRIHQQYVLDCRPGADCIVGRRRGFHSYLGVKMLPDMPKVEGGHAAIRTPRYNRFRHLLTASLPENGLWRVRLSPFLSWRSWAWGW